LAVRWDEEDIAEMLGEFARPQRVGSKRLAVSIVVALSIIALVLAHSAFDAFRSGEALRAGPVAVPCTFALVALAYAAWWRWYWRTGPLRWAHRAIRNSGGALTAPREVTISRASIAVESADGLLRLPWHAVERIAVGSRAVHVITRGQQDILVPRRAFEDPAEFERLVEFMERCRMEAPSHLLECPRCRYSFLGRTGRRCPECGWEDPPRTT